MSAVLHVFGLIVLGILLWRTAFALNESSVDYSPYPETFFTYSANSLIKPNSLYVSVEELDRSLPGLKNPRLQPVSPDSWVIDPYSEALRLQGRFWGQCVNWFKYLKNLEGSLGNAWNLKPNTEIAGEGTGILIGSNHIGYIHLVYASTTPRIIYSDANAHNDGVVRIYDISIDDPIIRGFYAN